MLKWVTLEISFEKFECAKLKDNCVLKITDDPPTSKGIGELRLFIISNNGKHLLEKFWYSSHTSNSKETLLKQIKEFAEFLAGEEFLQEKVI